MRPPNNGEGHYYFITRAWMCRIYSQRWRTAKDYDAADPNKYKFAVGGVGLNMLIDSGTTSNIIDEVTWETLKS